MAEDGRATGVDAQDEEGDEDHAEAGASQQGDALPVHGQGRQDLRGAKHVGTLPLLSPPGLTSPLQPPLCPQTLPALSCSGC